MYINELSESERALFVSYLGKYLPDDRLVMLVEEIQEARAQIRKDVRTCAKAMGENTVAAIIEHEERKERTPLAPAIVVGQTNDIVFKKEYIPPPGEPAARITDASKTTILSLVANGNTFKNIHSALSGRPDNTQRLLTLLWARNFIKFDGEKYYDWNY